MDAGGNTSEAERRPITVSRCELCKTRLQGLLNTLFFTYFLRVIMEQQSTTKAYVRARRAKISEGMRGNSKAEGKTCRDLGTDAGEADHRYQLIVPPTSLLDPTALSLNVLEPTAADTPSLAKLAPRLARLGLAW